MVTAQERLNQILPFWYDLLTQWSLDGSLVAAATDALVLDSSNAKDGSAGLLQSYVSQWSAGNFHNLPPILLLPSEQMGGVWGAYASSTNTTYLNKGWLNYEDSGQIQSVLTEELGHWLDFQLNTNDTRGDEGELLRLRLMSRDQAEKSATLGVQYDDNSQIVLGGKIIDIECYSNNTEFICGGEVRSGYAVDSIVGSPSPDPYFYNGDGGNGVYYNGFKGRYNEGAGSTEIGTYGTGDFFNSSQPLSSGAFFNGFSATGTVFVGGKSGSVGRIVNGYSGSGTFWNGYGSPGFIKIGGSDATYSAGGIGKLINGSTSGSKGLFKNGVSSARGVIYNGQYGTGSIENGLLSGIGHFLNGANGELYSYAGSTIENGVNGIFINDGLLISWGTFTNKGTLAGSGIFEGSLLAELGTLSPGGQYTDSYSDTTGTFSITGSYSQSQSASLTLSLASGFQSDCLQATNNISINGGIINIANLSLLLNNLSSGVSTVLIAADSDKDGIGLLTIAPTVLASLAQTIDSYDSSSIDYSLSFGSNSLLLNASVVQAKNAGTAVFRINGNGTGQDVQNLTCSLDQLDPDGMIKLPPSKMGDPTNGYGYQWQVSSDGVNWANATGTGANTFKYSVNLTADASKSLRVQVGYVDDKGFQETVYTSLVKILSGTSKNDSFAGTSGVEVTLSGSGADAVATGAGNDFAKGGIGNDAFAGADGDGDDFFDGQTEIDVLNYSASAKGVDIDFVTGLATERTADGIGKDSFAGIENARGTSGADIFTGNSGINTFTGSGGADVFRFINKQLGAAACDHITDFSGDQIQLSKAAFGLAAINFASVSGSKAANVAAASLVYDTGTGYLYLNADGATAGFGAGGGVVAILDNKAALTASNFLLV